MVFEGLKRNIGKTTMAMTSKQSPNDSRPDVEYASDLGMEK